MWWGCGEQGIPIAFKPHHHLEMLVQHHILHVNYPVHP